MTKKIEEKKTHKLRVIKDKKTKKTKKDKKKTISLGKDGEMTVSDPDALPHGKPEQDKRITDAQAAGRWVKMGDDFSEEWQRVILIAINGLTTITKIFPPGAVGMSGAVKRNAKGEDEPADDAVMFIDAVDKQIIRLTEVKKYFDKHTLLLDGVKVRDNFNDDFDKAYEQLVATGRSGIIPARDNLLTLMESIGFKFKIEKQLLIGDKYLFEVEPLYVAKDIDVSEEIKESDADKYK